MSTTKELKRELDQWQTAATNSLSTIKWLEERGDQKNKRIRELEAQVRQLGGKP